jgi:hypothetical protein
MEMKQFVIKFAAFIASVAALSSCVKENTTLEPDQAVGSEFTLYLVQTKTANNGQSTEWVSGDKVNVFHAETGTANYINDGAFTFSAEDRFTGSINGELEAGKTYDWYVAYPFDPSMESPQHMRVNIPTIQNQLADGDMSHLCEDLCPLAGKALTIQADQTPSIMMQHLVTVMKIKVTNYHADPCNLQTVSFNHHTKRGVNTVLAGAHYADITSDSMELVRAEGTDADDSVGDVTRPYIQLQEPKLLSLNESATVYIVCKPFTISNSEILSVGMNNTAGGVDQAIYGKNVICRAGVINGIKQGSRQAPPFKSRVTFYAGKKNPDGTYTLDNPDWWRCELPEDFDLQGSFNFKDLFTTVNTGDASFTLIDKKDQNVTVQSMYEKFESCLDVSSGQWTGDQDLDVNLYFPERDRSGIFVNSNAGHNVGSWAIMYYEPVRVPEPPQVDLTSDTYDTYEGLVMAGYQGWHGTPGDGCPHNPAEGWPHYASVAQHPFVFEPGVLRNNIDFWPDVSEYEKTYAAHGFTSPDGSTPRLYSSYDASTVNLHFKWMKQYGIDGVFMQRFVSQITDDIALSHSDKVLESAMMASNVHARAISIMYDMVGMTAGTSAEVVLNDARQLVQKYNLMDRAKGQRYFLYHNGKPLIGLVSVGQNSAPYTVAQAQAIVDGLQEMGFSIMLGVPAYWRSANGHGDVVNDPMIIELIKDVDIIMPWFVGAYDYDGTVPTTPRGSFADFFNDRIIDDFTAAESYGVDFCPLIFPGFSDRNMHPDHYVYDRHSGNFYWQQIYKFINQGARMLYVAMFDEIDEGTAIYKCLRKNEVPSNVYSSDYYVVYENGAYRRSDEPVSVSEGGWCRKASDLGVTFNGIENDLESDYYLRLTGEAGKILKDQAKLTSYKPF